MMYLHSTYNNSPVFNLFACICFFYLCTFGFIVLMQCPLVQSQKYFSALWLFQNSNKRIGVKLIWWNLISCNSHEAAWNLKWILHSSLDFCPVFPLWMLLGNALGWPTFWFSYFFFFLFPGQNSQSILQKLLKALKMADIISILFDSPKK